LFGPTVICSVRNFLFPHLIPPQTPLLWFFLFVQTSRWCFEGLPFLSNTLSWRFPGPHWSPPLFFPPPPVLWFPRGRLHFWSSFAGDVKLAPPCLLSNFWPAPYYFVRLTDLFGVLFSLPPSLPPVLSSRYFFPLSFFGPPPPPLRSFMLSVFLGSGPKGFFVFPFNAPLPVFPDLPLPPFIFFFGCLVPAATPSLLPPVPPLPVFSSELYHRTLRNLVPAAGALFVFFSLPLNFSGSRRFLFG